MTIVLLTTALMRIKWYLSWFYLKNLKQTSTLFVKYIDPLSFWLVQSHKGINNMHGKLSKLRQQTNQTGLMKSAI